MPTKPPFDPSQPFQTAGGGKPAFDPTKPFDTTTAPRDRIEQEMHPAFGVADRLVVKNLANDTQAGVAYLQKQHPDLEVKADGFSGQIIARKKDGSEKTWKVLDPDTGFFSTDFLYDVGDLGYDALSGVGTGAATAVGGVLGAAAGAAGGPAGATAGGLAGASAAGGATSGAFEALRQAAGKALDVPQNMDWGNVGIATGVGAVSPLIFGTGATAGQVAKAAAGSAGKATMGARVLGAIEAGAANPFAREVPTVVSTAAKDAGGLIGGAQRGGVGTLWDLYRQKVAPKIGSTMSGIDRASIETYRDNPGLVNEIKNTGELNYGENLVQNATNKVVQKRQAIGAGQASVRTEVSAITDDLLADVAHNGPRALTPDIVQHFDPAKLAKRNIQTTKDLADHLMVDVSPVRGEFDALLNKAMDLWEKSPTPENREAIDHLFQVVGTKISDGDFLPMDAAYNLRRSLDQLGKRHKVAQGTSSAIADGTPQAAIDLQLAAKSAAVKLNDQMDEVFGLFEKGKGFGDLTNKAYSQTKLDSKYLKAFTADPEKALAKLKNLAGDAKEPTRQRLARIDEAYGSNLLAEARKLRAYQDFKNASLNPLSGGGTTSTSRTIPAAALGAGLGYYVGANSGLGQGGAGIGAAGGGLVGAFLGGPAALKAYMALQRAGTRAATTARNVGLRPNQVVPTWLLMEQQARENRP